MRQIAQVMGQARGWNTTLVAELDRALVILLSGHADDQPLRYSQLVDVLHRYGVSITRVAEVLSRGGLLDDDRVPAFESWLEDKLGELAPEIAGDVRAWIRVLQHGGPRSHPRHPSTMRRSLRAIHPVLIEWPARYQHLREVTTSDVTALAHSLHGHPRRPALGALRSLMHHCKKTGSIFTDPTTRIRIGHRDDPILLPLAPEQLEDTAQAATTPAARVALALAAVHAARPQAIRNLQLGDVDLGNRRLTIAGLTRPLDELTHHLLTDWLTYRRTRWPHTANLHLLVIFRTYF
jgi:integrase